MRLPVKPHDLQAYGRMLDSHFLNLYSVALSDTEFHSKELELLYEIGVRRGVGTDEIEQLLLHPDRAEFHPPVDFDTKIEYLYDFARMILADGVIDDYELEVFAKFCDKFGFVKEHSREIFNFLSDAAQGDTPIEDVVERARSKSQYDGI